MQPQGQTVESSTAFGFIGGELFTTLQVLCFLALGYAIAGVWRCSVLPRTPKVGVKAVDDVDTASVPCEDMAVQAARSAKAVVDGAGRPPSHHPGLRSLRLSNAAERKRMRKASQTESKKPVKDSVAVTPRVVTEEPPCTPSQDCLEAAAVVEVTAPSQEILVQHVAFGASPGNQHTSKLMVKKAARKARKSQQQTEAVKEQVKDEVHKANKDDPKAAMSPTASTLSMASGGTDTSEPDASPRAQEFSDCSAPDSTLRQPIDGIDVSLTDKALAKLCLGSEEAQGQDTLWEEAGVLIFGSLPESVPVVPCASDTVPSASPDQGPTAGELPRTDINFDDIESDTDSDVDFADRSSMPVSILDTSQSCGDIPAAPIMWCNPDMLDERGWMAVAVPAECAPAGAFDGLWKNDADERILIEKLEIMFESGVSWTMEMHSITGLSVTLDGQQLYAELDSTGQQLVWTDGDIWTFHGCSAPAGVPEVACMPTRTIGEEMQMLSTFQFTEELPMLPTFQFSEEVAMLPNLQCAECMLTPPQAQKWETCWDWEKKGWCPRGMDCEWHHPSAEASFY